MMLQSTMFEQQKIDLSSAPWTMHEFFAGSGLVAYGLKGMFRLFGLTISASKRQLFIKLTLVITILNLMISKIFEDMSYRAPICRGPAFPAKICH